MGGDGTAGLRPAAVNVSASFRPRWRPLAPVKDHVTVISNLELRNAYPGTHATSNSAFLSARRARLTESARLFSGNNRQMKIAAQQIGRGTQLPSLELSMDLLTVAEPVRQRPRCVSRAICRGPRRRRRFRANHIRALSSNASSAMAPTSAERRSSNRASLLDSVMEGIHAAQ